MMKTILLSLFGLVACLAGSPRGLSAAPAVSAERTESGVRVLVDGKVFTEYFGAGAQRPYLYPIIGPSGANLARGESAVSHFSTLGISHKIAKHGFEVVIRRVEALDQKAAREHQLRQGGVEEIGLVGLDLDALGTLGVHARREHKGLGDQ